MLWLDSLITPSGLKEPYYCISWNGSFVSWLNASTFTIYDDIRGIYQDWKWMDIVCLSEEIVGLDVKGKKGRVCTWSAIDRELSTMLEFKGYELKVSLIDYRSLFQKGSEYWELYYLAMQNGTIFKRYYLDEQRSEEVSVTHYLCDAIIKGEKYPYTYINNDNTIEIILTTPLDFLPLI